MTAQAVICMGLAAHKGQIRCDMHAAYGIGCGVFEKLSMYNSKLP